MAPQKTSMRFTVLALLVGVAGCSAAAQGRSGSSAVERGRYLVETEGCSDCHSPKIFTANGPIPDTTRLLSGFPANSKVPLVPGRVIGPQGWGTLGSNDFTAWAGPWGVSFAPNLTPDGTGLRGWTDTMFIAAMRTGKHMGAADGRAILPPMPWYNFAKFTDEDLRAILAYLRTLRPVRNQVPPPVVPGVSHATR